MELCERGPGSHQAPVVALLQETLGAMTAAEAAAMLGAIDVCWGPVNTLVEALDDPHLNVRGAILKDGTGRRHIASPIRFRHDPARPSLHVPALNEHAAFAARITRTEEV